MEIPINFRNDFQVEISGSISGFHIDGNDTEFRFPEHFSGKFTFQSGKSFPEKWKPYFRDPEDTTCLRLLLANQTEEDILIR